MEEEVEIIIIVDMFVMATLLILLLFKHFETKLVNNDSNKLGQFLKKKLNTSQNIIEKINSKTK